MTIPLRHWRITALALLSLLLATANAARTQQLTTKLLQDPSVEEQMLKKRLNTYYFDMYKPVVQLSSQGSGREGRTALSIQLSEGSVSGYMPVVSPQAAGMTHEVAKTWEVLKNLAAMFDRSNALNKLNPTGQRLFPRTALALTAAADHTTPVQHDISSSINTAEAHGLHHLWTETTPGSVLLLPHGQSVGAIADVLDATYDDVSGVVSLVLDVVHSPHLISEFEAHADQSLDVDQAHYHLTPGSGVKLDAATLLTSLLDPNNPVQGLHAFLKGFARPPTCCGATLTPVPSDVQVADGSIINITVAVDCTTGCSSATTATLGGMDVKRDYQGWLHLVVTGPAVWTDASVLVRDAIGAVARNKSTSGRTVRQGSLLKGSLEGPSAYPNVTDGNAWATLRIDGAGPVGVQPIYYTEFNRANSGYFPQSLGLYIFFNVGGGVSTAPVSRLVLFPSKAYRHINDPITLTATALDDAFNRVEGANVVFAVYGDCTPTTSQTNVTTDETGRAMVTLNSADPGAVSLVAAAINANGVPVLAAPSHIIFFDKHQYIDEREEDYYRDSGRDGGSGDAERYSQVASKMALQQISNKGKSA